LALLANSFLFWQVSPVPSVVLDNSKLDANSRVISIRLVLATLRLMENWRELADDYDKIIILLAASAVSGDPFTRGEGLEGDLRNLRISLPEERYLYGNMRSIADAIGLNRETARRKIHELVEAGLLMRTADGVRFDPASRQVDQTVDLLRRQLDLLFRFINEMIRDGIASVK